METHLLMSAKERLRLKVMDRVVREEIALKDAARQLGISDRQAIRIAKRYREQGDVGLVHRLRGRPSGRAIDPTFKSQVLALCEQNYPDFGPTLASETLQERHGLHVHPETLRLWMARKGLWQVRTPKTKHRSRRPRKECFGEMVQMDGSPHDWFEGRGPKCVLMSMVDDATNTTMLLFAEQETTRSAMDLLALWVSSYGCPQALYTDHDSVYVTDRKTTLEEELQGKQAQTQFGRACDVLGLRIIPAGSPQAKGRIERKHGVCQDRLIKQMRLAGISTIAEANAFLKEWLPAFNQKFVKPARSDKDAHRPLDPGLDLRAVLCIEEHRSVASDWTIRYQNRFFQIPRQSHMPRAGAKVVVQQWRDGSIHLRNQGRELLFHELDERPQRPAKPKQPSNANPYKPAPDHPWRQLPAPRVPDVPSDIYKPTPLMLEDIAETYLGGQDFLQSLTDQLGHF